MSYSAEDPCLPCGEPVGDGGAAAKCRPSIPDTETGDPMVYLVGLQGQCDVAPAAEKAKAAKSALKKLEAFAKEYCREGECPPGSECKGTVGDVTAAVYKVEPATKGKCQVTATLTATIRCTCVASEN